MVAEPVVEEAPTRPQPAVEPPLSLLAELTYRCVLQCPYCSNPLRYAESHYRQELSTEEWHRVLGEAGTLGVVQLALSGGEPTLRKDLLEIVQRANEVGLYSTLVTAGTMLPDEKLAAYKEAGLDHVQISLQGASPEISDTIAGTKSFHEKVAACVRVRAHGFPLTLNVVLHRLNLHQVPDFIAIAEEVGADKIELANTQYHGWALVNRNLLMPTPEQVSEAEAFVRKARARLGSRLEIVYVLPDYFEDLPKPCLDGWARRFLTITPNGDVLPCQAAGDIKGLSFDNVRERALDWIWYESSSFNAFRGTEWMPEPCRSCPLGRQEIDFGGCRCQAFALTGDARRTDPVCKFSPDRGVIDAAIAAATSSLVVAPADVPTVPVAGTQTGAAISHSRSEPDTPPPPGNNTQDPSSGLLYRTPRNMRELLRVID
jgi:pyrroloquinoline quinone biosynthesis protein E